MRSAAACSRSVAALVLAATLAGASLAAAGEVEDAPTLDQLLEGMASSSGVVTLFRESRTLSLLVLPLESSGLLYFSPPNRMARFTFEPAVSSLIIDGERLRVREGESGEVVDLTGNPMAHVFVDNFIVLFNGDGESLRERYHVQIAGEPGAEAWSLALAPRSAPLEDVIEGITLFGDARGITRMEMRSRDGDTTTTHLETIDRDRSFTPPELDRLFREGAPLERDRKAR